MGSLTLRYDESEHVLRSTNETPGVVVFAFPDREPSLAVDYAWETSRQARGVTTVTMHPEGIAPTATAVSIEDCVAGCVGADELRHLYGIACQAVRDGAGVLLAAQEFATLRELVDYVEKLAGAIEDRLDP